MAAPQPARDAGRRIVVVSPAPRRRRALARRVDRRPGRGAARPSSSSPSSRCDPDSTAPAGGWDRRGGFATEGESARARREEDRPRVRRARRDAGVAPVRERRLRAPRRRGRRCVDAVVAPRSTGADVVLVPGFPLSHPDHDWLVRTLVAGALGRWRVALYAEQPYTRRAGASRRAGWVAERSARGVRAGPHGCATASRSGARSAATARSSRCSGCAGASGAARTATRSLPSGSPGAPD